MRNFDEMRKLGLEQLRNRALAVRFAPRRASLDVGGTIGQAVELLAEGNLGALNILQRLVGMGMPHRLLDLDDMNIRGEQLWVAYKDHCKSIMQKFVEAVEARDSDMVRTVNEVARQRGIPYVAKTRGGAP